MKSRGEGENPIHVAIRRGYFQQVRFLIDHGHNVNGRDSQGRTPLILCSLIGEEEWGVGLARTLIEHGAKISVYDAWGLNALHYACIYQRANLAQAFLAALDCDIHSKCKRGNTPLHFAAQLGNTLITTAIASLGAKYEVSLDPVNKAGFTPLQQAWKAHHILCGDILVKMGADENKLVPYDKKKTAADLRKEAVDIVDRISRLSQRAGSSHAVRQIVHGITMQMEPLMHKELKAEEIQEVKSYDLRNTPEYVFKTSAINYFLNKEKPMAEKGHNSKSALSWRPQLLELWSEYEQQCTSSFKKSATPLTDESRRNESIVISHDSPASVQHRRGSKLSFKSARSNSVSSNDIATLRKLHTTKTEGRKAMPPLVRTQSRASFVPN